MKGTLDQLRVVKESLQIEREGASSAENGLYEAEHALAEDADAASEAGSEGESVSGGAQAAYEDALEQASLYAPQNRTTQYKDGVENGPALKRGAFSKKLKSLGVDIASEEVREAVRVTPGIDRVRMAVDMRITALERGIKEKSLALPGEKDTMTVELLRARSLLSEDSLRPLKDEAKHIREVADRYGREEYRGPVFKLAAAQVDNPRYPVAVRKAAMAQVLREVYPEMDRSEIENAAEQQFSEAA